MDWCGLVLARVQSWVRALSFPPFLFPRTPRTLQIHPPTCRGVGPNCIRNHLEKGTKASVEEAHSVRAAPGGTTGERGLRAAFRGARMAHQVRVRLPGYEGRLNPILPAARPLRGARYGVIEKARDLRF